MSHEDDRRELEEAAQKAKNRFYKLRLFVTGSTPRSSAAVLSVRELCEEHLAGRYDLEVVDLYQQPNRAMRDQILAAPTLVRELPEPIRKLVGDLTNPDRVLNRLEVSVI